MPIFFLCSIRHLEKMYSIFRLFLEPTSETPSIRTMFWVQKHLQCPNYILYLMSTAHQLPLWTIHIFAQIQYMRVCLWDLKVCFISMLRLVTTGVPPLKILSAIRAYP